MAKAKKALPSSRSLILTPALIKTWVNPHKLWRKKLFCAKSMTTLGDLTVYVFYFYFRWLSVVNSFLSDVTGIHSKSTDFTFISFVSYNKNFV